MESQRLADQEEAQELVRKELQGVLADTVGENAPVEVIILFQCPDGQFGFCATNYAGALKQVGMLESAKAAIINGMAVLRASSDSVGPQVASTGVN
jgi:hypothetical protein